VRGEEEDKREAADAAVAVNSVAGALLLPRLCFPTEVSRWTPPLDSAQACTRLSPAELENQRACELFHRKRR
jgi:hypothetical protein